MKRKKPSARDMLSACSEIRPEDGLDPRMYFRPKAEKKPNRKALQLCSEVAKAVGFALSWEAGDQLLSSLVVESVVPAPDSGRLLITVSFQGSGAVEPERLMERLQRVTGKLRAAVAESIHRRRVPELTFRVADKGVGSLFRTQDCSGHSSAPRKRLPTPLSPEGEVQS
jgi:ribosome-binding factor A